MYPVPNVQLISIVTVVLFPLVRDKRFRHVPVIIQLPGYEPMSQTTVCLNGQNWKDMILKEYSCNYTDHKGHAVFNTKSAGSSIMTRIYEHLSLFLLCFVVICRCRP